VAVVILHITRARTVFKGTVGSEFVCLLSNAVWRRMYSGAKPPRTYNRDTV
jgi:hypothetical protein